MPLSYRMCLRNSNAETQITFLSLWTIRSLKSVQMAIRQDLEITQLSVFHNSWLQLLYFEKSSHFVRYNDYTLRLLVAEMDAFNDFVIIFN